MTRRYTAADIALLTQKGLTAALPPPRVRLSDEASESCEQQATVRWWANACQLYGLPEIALMAFPMQGARTPRNGARMKREGARKGTLDMMLSVQRGGWAGLWIENKTEKGKLSDEQKNMRDHLVKQGYNVRVCRSSDQTINAIKSYLSL